MLHIPSGKKSFSAFNTHISQARGGHGFGPLDRFLADRFNNSIKCETSSVKHDGPLSEVLLPIAIMDLIGNWKFKYSHTNDLSPYMVVT